MDFFNKNTDKPSSDAVLHLASFSRLFPGGPRISSAGYFPAKTTAVVNNFDTFNFSFILSGKGYYTWEGKSLPVTSPCVLTQYPGVPMDYGPETQWEEFFVIYDKSQLPVLKSRNFADRELPFWHFKPDFLFYSTIESILSLFVQGSDRRIADKMDTLAGQLVVTTKCAMTHVSRKSETELVYAIETYVRNNVHKQPKLGELAEKHAIHEAKLRRLWDRIIGIPYHTYVSQLKISEACRLLMDTDMEVREIALAMGYDDEFYFSRKFKKSTGSAPSFYRERLRFERGF